MSPLALLPALPPAETPAAPQPVRWAQLCFPADWAVPPAAEPDRKKAYARRPDRHLALIPLSARPVQQSFPVVRLFEFDNPAGRRKCSPYARARTVPPSKIGDQRKDKRTRDLWDVSIEKLRPKTRADCKDGPRPCPWFLCRYHLALDVHPERGSIKETFPQLRILTDPEGPGLEVLEEIVGTCALDICDKNDDGTGTSGLGGLLALRQAALAGKPLGNTPGLNIEDTGRRLNLSIERIRQLSSDAMQEMRVKLRRSER